MPKFKTNQELFWRGQFGNEYIVRNQSEELLAANLHFFAKALENINKLNSIFEVGCNIGMNFAALQLLFPDVKNTGIEINEKAAEIARQLKNTAEIINDSIVNFDSNRTFDLVFSKGVLIHLNPDELPSVYKKMAKLSGKYVLIAEYFNPAPVSLTYRGHEDRLFKRDFANEFMGANPEFKLRSYAFHYKNVNNFSQDNITWFLMERES